MTTKQIPGAKLAKPCSMQLMYQEVRDGLPIRVYGTLGGLIIRVYLNAEGKALQIVMPLERYKTLTLDEIIGAAYREAMDAIPVDASLAPHRIIQ